MNNIVVKVSRPSVIGFEHINRYWDKTFELIAAKILPGEYYVTQENELITTVLGSCVSACIRDREMGIGGMNHFMLPITTSEKLKKDAIKNQKKVIFIQPSLKFVESARLLGLLEELEIQS